MTSTVPGQAPSLRRRFRAWRRNRPTWGVVFIILSGAEIYSLTMSPYQFAAIEGIAGASALVIFGVCLTMGLVCLFQPAQHAVTGALCLIAALASLPLSNLGGFLIGMLMGIHGSSLMISWKPPQPEQQAELEPVPATDTAAFLAARGLTEPTTSGPSPAAGTLILTPDRPAVRLPAATQGPADGQAPEPASGTGLDDEA